MRRRRSVAMGIVLALLTVLSTLAIGAATPAGAEPGQAPRGSLDRLVLTFEGGRPTVVAEGWSFDPDSPSRPNVVMLRIGSSNVASVRAAGYRPDIEMAFPFAGSAHGFSIRQALPAGTHRICAVARNYAGTGGTNTTLGCGTINVPGIAGSIDSAVQRDGWVLVSGWAIDGQRQGVVNVRISNWAGSVTVPAKLLRPDVGWAFPGYGPNHGFDTGLNANAGPVCVDVLSASGQAIGRIGCREVLDLDKPSPGPGWQDSMLWAVNKERAGRGAAPVVQCPALTNAAQGYADQMASTGRFAHTDAQNRGPAQRVTAAGYSWTKVAENIAAGQRDVYSVMVDWVYSPGHFANIVDPAFTHVGFGATPRPGGGWYWVQNFARGTCP